MNIEKALAEDPNAFDYDEVYDDVQAKKLRQSKTEKANADCKVRTVVSVMNSKSCGFISLGCFHFKRKMLCLEVECLRFLCKVM